MKQKMYEVDKIVNYKQLNNKKYYEIKWKGYESSQNTWEPIQNLTNIKRLIRKFDNQWKIKNKSNNISRNKSNNKNRKKSLEKSNSTLKRNALDLLNQSCNFEMKRRRKDTSHNYINLSSIIQDPQLTRSSEQENQKMKKNNIQSQKHNKLEIIGVTKTNNNEVIYKVGEKIFSDTEFLALNGSIL